MFISSNFIIDMCVGIRGVVLNWFQSFRSFSVWASCPKQHPRLVVGSHTFWVHFLFLYRCFHSDPFLKSMASPSFITCTTYKSVCPYRRGLMGLLLNCLMDVHSWLGKNFFYLKRTKQKPLFLVSQTYWMGMSVQQVHCLSTVSTLRENLDVIFDSGFKCDKQINKLQGSFMPVLFYFIVDLGILFLSCTAIWSAGVV